MVHHRRDQVPKPIILILWFDRSIFEITREMLRIGGYIVRPTRTADETLRLLEWEARQYVVLMDTYYLNDEAERLLNTLPARPELSARVKVIGLAALSNPIVTMFDAYVALPFEFDGLLDTVARLSAALRAAD